MLQYKVSQKTHIGGGINSRFNDNEDYKLVDKRRGLCIIADGMGGRSGGYIAGRLAANLLYNKVRTVLKHLKTGVLKEDDVSKYLEASVEFVNQCLYLLSVDYDSIRKDLDILSGRLFTMPQDNADITGTQLATNLEGIAGLLTEFGGIIPPTIKEIKKFGTTLDVCFVYNDKAHIAHVGDGRVYQFNHSRGLERLTKDHSSIGVYGDCSEEDKKILKMQASLTNYIGKQGAFVDTNSISLGHGDYILMGSDGLFNVVADEEIAKILSSHSMKKVHELVNLANNPKTVVEWYAKYHNIDVKEALREIGGTDNITAILIYVYENK